MDSHERTTRRHEILPSNPNLTTTERRTAADAERYLVTVTVRE